MTVTSQTRNLDNRNVFLKAWPPKEAA